MLATAIIITITPLGGIAVSSYLMAVTHAVRWAAGSYQKMFVRPYAIVIWLMTLIYHTDQNEPVGCWDKNVPCSSFEHGVGRHR